MGVSVLAQALKVNTSVEEIYIQGNDGGDVGVKSLCDALLERPGPIKTLDIGNNTMTEEGAQNLAKLLKAKQLVELDVYNNDFGDAGMYQIAGSLKDNKSLTSLDLGGNNVGADGMKALASAIKNCDTLRVLELSYNPMGPEGAKAIAEVSKYDLQLETLKVGWCKIGSGDGAKAIGDLIMFNTTISSLDLRGNNLGDEGAISIARSMKEHDNQHFAELDMGYNEIKDAGACALAQSLKANVEGAVKELKLNQNYITRFGQVALNEALDLVYELGGGKETNIVF